jgi:hypothetical protein
MGEWTVKQQSLFKIFMPEEEELAILRGYILLEATPDGTVEDNFQVCVRGDLHVKVTFPAAQLLDIPKLVTYQLQVEAVTEELLFMKNQITSPWLDLGGLVQKGSVTITRDNKEDHEEFLTSSR